MAILAALKAAVRYPRLPLYLGLALLAIALLGLSYCQGRKDGRAAADAERDRANVEALKTTSAAADRAAFERLASARQQVEEQKELDDVEARYDDPDDRRVARGCVILRQQGADTDHIAACRRLDGGEGTGLPD